MNAATRLLQVGDRVRFEGNDIDDTGIVTEVHDNTFVNVRWSAVPIQSSHRMHELELIPNEPTPEHYTQLLKLLAEPDGDHSDD
jgi:hypothetical protein